MKDEEIIVPDKNKDLGTEFNNQATKEPETLNIETQNIAFEKYKLKINLFKWLIGTVGIALITFIINWGFKDRAVGMTEIAEYNTKFATDLIVLNENPVKKRMLAQFFSTVTPSKTLKSGWELYFKEVDKDYIKFFKDKKENEARLITLNGKKVLTKRENEEKKVRELTNEKNERIENAPTIIPESLDAHMKPTVYIHYSNKENKSKIKDIQSEIITNNFNAPGIEYQNSCDNTIRYFNDEDREFATRLQTAIGGDQYRVVKAVGKAAKGQIELWIEN